MPSGGRKASGGGQLSARLRTGKGRTASSRRWLQRQIKDPYVAAARQDGWRSRSAYKLIDLDDRFHLLAPGRRVVDLGAAPGGWTQVAVKRVRAGQPHGGRVVAIDPCDMEPIPGATIIEADTLALETPALVRDALGGAADVVLSDMAAPATGHKTTDRLRAMALFEAAFAFAGEVLTPGGSFVCKMLRGGTEAGLLAEAKRQFASVKHVKPPSSRADSAEIFLVATGFRDQSSNRDHEYDEEH